MLLPSWQLRLYSPAKLYLRNDTVETTLIFFMVAFYEGKEMDDDSNL